MLGSVGDESVVELIAGAVGVGLAAVAAAGDNPKSGRSAPGLVVPLREWLVFELASVSAGPTPPPVALGRSEAAIGWSAGASSGLLMLVVAALAISSSSGWLSSVMLLLLLSRASSDGDAGTVEVAVEGLRRRPAISPPRKPKWSKWPLGLAAWWWCGCGCG